MKQSDRRDVRSVAIDNENPLMAMPPCTMRELEAMQRADTKNSLSIASLLIPFRNESKFSLNIFYSSRKNI